MSDLPLLEVVTRLESDLLLSDADTVIEFLQKVKADNPNATSIKTALFGDYGEIYGVCVFISRLETTSEYSARVKCEEEALSNEIKELYEKYELDRKAILMSAQTIKGAHD